MDAPKAQGRRADQKLRNLIRAKKGRSNMDYRKILAATAAVIGTVAMADGIVSSSVVGYQAVDTTAQDNIYLVQTLLPIGATLEEVKIGNIKPSAEWDASLGDWLGTVSPSGEQEDIYTWQNGGWYALDPETWEVTGDCVDNTATIPYNGALVVYSDAGATLTFAGEVLTGDIEMKTNPQDNAYTGNLTPVEIDISDIVPSNWDASLGDWLGTVAASGEQVDIYTYNNDGWYALDPETWEITGECVNGTVKIAPGQSLVVYTDAGSLNVKGAL